MDERCQRFATDAAAKPHDAKAIATLRKFLFRNQETRLSSAAQQYLCDAVVRHASAAAAATADEQGKESSAEAATALVEDALAMPFNIFTTSHKKQLLKHLDRLRGAQGGGGVAGGGGANDDARECTVLEVTPEGKVELMDDEGETATVEELDEEHLQAIRERGEEDVRVRAIFVASAAAKTKNRGSGGGGAGGGSEGGFNARILGIM